jgi:hypothetical protein
MSGVPGPSRPAHPTLPPTPADARRARDAACPALAMPYIAALVLALAAACQPSPDELDDGKLPATDPHCAPDVEGVFPDTADPQVDYDCDGWPKDEDCNNRNSEIHPAAPEFNNGVDDDCDGDAGLLYGCGTGANDSLGLAALLTLGLAARRRARGSWPLPLVATVPAFAGKPPGLPCDPPRDGAP